MSEKEEQIYERGSRMAWTLQECLSHLGYKGTEAETSDWIGERELVISSLRSICEEFGDNNWDSNLHLQDIIEKHLADYLYEEKTR